MARSTKQGDRRIWVASRHPVNKTLQVQGFSDTLESQGDADYAAIEMAESKAAAFMSGMPVSKIMDGCSTAEQAIAAAESEGF